MAWWRLKRSVGPLESGVEWFDARSSYPGFVSRSANRRHDMVVLFRDLAVASTPDFAATTVVPLAWMDDVEEPNDHR